MQTTLAASFHRLQQKEEKKKNVHGRVIMLKKQEACSTCTVCEMANSLTRESLYEMVSVDCASQSNFIVVGANLQGALSLSS